MGLFRKGTDFKIREDKLTIFKKDKKYKTENWYCRFSIDGHQYELSSKTSNKKNAIKILGDLFDEYKVLKKTGNLVRTKSFRDCWKEYTSEIKSGIYKSGNTSTGYLNKGRLLVDFFKNKRVDKITYDELKDYLVWRLDNNLGKGNRSRKIQRETLVGDLRVFSIFDTWCVDKGYRTKKLSNLQKRLKSTLGNKEDTSRLFFNRDEYQKLLTKSKQRIKSAEQGGLDGGKKVAFNRKLLHQFIIFGVNTGIRVGGILNLKWEDCRLRDKKLDYIGKGIEKNYGKDFWNTLDRYYTINNVKDKTGVHENIGLGGSYFALERIRKLKEDYYGKVEKSSDKIFNVKTFAVGFNALLESANLKNKKIGDKLKRRDAVSLRHTYIVFQIQNNISEFIIGKNVGTSGKMIYENYTKNLKTIDLLEKLTNVHSEKSRQNRLVVIK